jgi:hypothetical protein
MSGACFYVIWIRSRLVLKKVLLANSFIPLFRLHNKQCMLSKSYANTYITIVILKTVFHVGIRTRVFCSCSRRDVHSATPPWAGLLLKSVLNFSKPPRVKYIRLERFLFQLTNTRSWIFYETGSSKNQSLVSTNSE